MKRTKLIALCTGFVALGFASLATAQELAEPPRKLPVEPQPEVQPESPEDAALPSARAVVAGAAEAAVPHDAAVDEPIGEVVTETVAEIRDALSSAEQVNVELSTIEFPEDELQYTLQILRRFGRTVNDGVERVDALAARIRDPLGTGMLDLQPYVADDGWDEVVELLYDDHCKEAKAKMAELAGVPGDDTHPALVYMWARIQMCAGEAKTGRATLETLARRDDAVGVLAARRLGEKVVVKASEDGEGTYLSTRLERAKKHAKQDVDAAMHELDALHREMKRSYDKVKVRRAQAQILEAAGRTSDAAELYVALYRQTLGWRINSSIEDEIARLEKKLGERILTYGERIDRMRHLVARGRYSQAKEVSIENAKIRGVSGREVRGWMFYRLALQAERDKDRTKAIGLFEKANSHVKDSEVRPRLYFGWARALRRVDRDSEAVKLYEKLCAEYSDHHLCDTATFEAGRLLQYANQHHRAIEKFDAVLTDFPSSDHVPDALWRKAFSLYLDGEYDEMVAPLERLRAEFPNETDASELSVGLKATYWLGVAHLRRGEAPAAERTLQEAVDRGPLTWYGRLAASRMKAQGWSPSVRLPDGRLTEGELRDLATLRVPDSRRFAVAAEFVRLGLWKDALSEMRDQVAIHPVPPGAHRLLASIYLANRQPNWAHWIMKKHIDESGPTHATLRDWGTAFPLDYMDLAHEHGTNKGVSPFLVQAIIRQESGFRPKVKSWAGAIGLMQLMPRTAGYTHKMFNGTSKRFSRHQLINPETNIELGTAYIRLHTAQAMDNIPLALAGYNAGPAPLESWLERYGDRELDAWVESITYREARGYVRKVFTSYITYSALYGGELPDVSLDVPTKLREWGDVPDPERVEQGEPVSLNF